MKANFHTHTYRCHHATGEDREYFEAAASRGLEVLGFSDHSPYYFPDGYYSNFRMRPDEVDGYVGSLTSLAEEFKGCFKTYIGYEMEYYPDLFDRSLAEVIKQNRCDYLILGQHFPKVEMGSPSSGSPHDRVEDLKDYVDSVCAAMKTGCFFYVAHPDLFNFSGDLDVYREQMKRICTVAKETDTPLEINLLGLRQGRDYPREEFWKIAAAVGNKSILGCDAHRPCDLADPDGILQGLEYAEKFGVEVIEPLEPKLLK